MTPEEAQAVRDEEHLRLLALFHYLSGGFTIFGSVMAGAWAVFVGVMFSAMPTDAANQAAAEQFETIPLIMAVMVGTFAALLCCYGVLEIVAGRFISQRRARAFTMVVGLPRVMFIPYGALLTILTLIVLDRRSVRHLYQPAAPASAQSVDLNPPAK